VYGGGIAWLGRWSLWWLAIVAAAVVLGIAVQYLWSILLPVILALVLTSVLLPPSRWLERRFGLRPALSAAAMVLAAVAAVALLFVFLVPTVGSQVVEIADSASDGLATVQDQLRSSDLGVTQDQIDSVIAAAQDRLQASGSRIAAGVLVGVGAVTNALINILVMLVLSFFFLKDGRRFLPWLTDLGGPTAGMHAAEVSRRSWETLSTFVRTQALVGLIDGVLIGAGLLVVGVPLALPLAVLTFVAAFAPIVGAVTVGILAVLVALVSNGWVAALIIAGVVLAVQQLEGNVLLPYLQGKSLDLHPAVVLLSIILGSTLFGVVGAFLSVPVVAVLAVVLRYLRDVARSRVAPVSPAGVVPEPEHGA
jgi:predicted PurR-regulated permease PerM